MGDKYSTGALGWLSASLGVVVGWLLYTFVPGAKRFLSATALRMRYRRKMNSRGFEYSAKWHLPLSKRQKPVEAICDRCLRDGKRSALRPAGGSVNVPNEEMYIRLHCSICDDKPEFSLEPTELESLDALVPKEKATGKGSVDYGI